MGEGGLPAQRAEARVRGNVETKNMWVALPLMPQAYRFAQMRYLLPQGEKRRLVLTLLIFIRIATND